MKLYRIRLTPRSPFGTPLKSDTLAGHLLCALRLKEGNERLEDTLEEIKKGRPPFILSDCFSADRLPMPALPLISRGDFRSLISKTFGNDELKALKAYKRFRKKGTHLSWEEWSDYRKLFTARDVFLDRYKMENSKREETESSRSVLQTRIIVDRYTGRSLDAGGLFHTEATHFAPVSGENSKSGFDLYLKCQKERLEEIMSLLQFVGEMGYGADASVGMGHFVIDAPQEMDGLESAPAGTNAWMSLSTFASHKPDAAQACYKLATRYGKVWSGFGETRPFKKPILMFEPGSVFPAPFTDWKSSVMRNIHSDTNIIQFTAPIMVPFTLKEPLC